MIRIVMVGDVVGDPGRRAFRSVIGQMKAQGMADFVVVNAENAAGGRGVSSALADQMFEQGADVITLGDHTWDQKDIGPYLQRSGRIVRPINLAPGCPGRGVVTVQAPFGPVTVVNLIGRVFMSPYDCPFRAMDAWLLSDPHPGGMVLVDFHAEATSEKIVMGRYLDGRVTAMAGTHTHVQTSDDRILPKGTAYITDMGMTGSRDSAIGRDLESITHRFLTGMSDSFKVAKRDVVLEGIRLEVDRVSGRAVSIERLQIPVADAAGDQQGE